MTSNMLTRILIFSIFIYNLLFTCYAVSQGVYIIPIHTERNVTYISVNIADVEIPRIIIDTGMPFDGIMIYNPAYRDTFDMSEAFRVEIGGAGDEEDSYAFMIDSVKFTVAGLEMTNQSFIMLQNDRFKGFPSNGIIGNSIFGHFMTEIDYDRNRMILYDSHDIKVDSSWTEIPLYFKENNIPWIDAYASIEDEMPVKFSMYIDYASGDAVEILEKPNMKFSLPEVTHEAYLGTGLSGDIFGKKGRIAKLIIGPYELKNVTAVFPPAKTRSKQKNADAILGNNLLRRFNLIFDYANKKLYIKPNSFFDEPFN
jgi:hypothetical protein